MGKHVLFATVVSSCITAAVVGGIAYAAIPDANGVIHGCVNNTSGAVRVIDTAKTQTCSRGETGLNWNYRGLTGATGPGALNIKFRSNGTVLSSSATLKGWTYTGRCHIATDGAVTTELLVAGPSGQTVTGTGWSGLKTDTASGAPITWTDYNKPTATTQLGVGNGIGIDNQWFYYNVYVRASGGGLQQVSLKVQNHEKTLASGQYRCMIDGTVTATS